MKQAYTDELTDSDSGSLGEGLSQAKSNLTMTLTMDYLC